MGMLKIAQALEPDQADVFVRHYTSPWWVGVCASIDWLLRELRPRHRAQQPQHHLPEVRAAANCKQRETRATCLPRGQGVHAVPWPHGGQCGAHILPGPGLVNTTGPHHDSVLLRLNTPYDTCVIGFVGETPCIIEVSPPGSY